MHFARSFLALPFFVILLLATAGSSLVCVAVKAQQQYDPSLYSGLHWRSIGPFRAGRVNAVSGVIGERETFYFGSVGGGVWKTMNAGRTWTPIFDSASAASIGAIGVARSHLVGAYEFRNVLDGRDFVALLVARSPWLDGLHATDADVRPALLVSLHPPRLRIGVGSSW